MYVNENIPVETVPEIGREGTIKDNGGGGWIQVWYIRYIVRTFINATMYPHTLKQ
jgi:hypothetical protein